MRLALALTALLASGCIEPPGDDDTAGDDDDAVEVGPLAFEDVTEAWGVQFDAPVSPVQPEAPVENGVGDWIAGGGALLVDLTGDDALDLLVTAPHGPNALFVNDGTGAFTKRAGSGLEEGPWILGATAADLDGDGLRDVLLLSDRSVRYFHNEGGGGFVDRGAILELGELERPSGVAAVDHDGDGILDLFVCVYGRNTDIAPRPGVDRLLRGLGNGAFEDVSGTIATDEERTGQCFQASWLDVEGDGRLEVHVGNDFGDWGPVNRLYAQDGADPWVMSEVAEQFSAAAEVDSMGGAVGDIDGDGYPEIAVSDTDHQILLQSYDPTVGLFTDVTAAWGAVPPAEAEFEASWALVMQDMDDDGDLDLLSAWGYPHYIANEPGRVDQRNSLHLWDETRGALTDASDLLVCDAPSRSWHGVLTGDIDRDGALDVVLTSNIGPVCILRGRPTGGAWLEVSLDGPRDNPDGLGARVDVRVGDRSWSRRVAAGNSGMHSDFEHSARFGLGTAASIDSVTVTWPGGETSTVTDVAPSTRIRIGSP